MTEQTTIRHEQEAKIIAKAWQDEAFKQELISNPKATLIRELGLEDVPDSLEIRVLEENPNTRYLVLPMKPVIAAGGGELPEEEIKIDEAKKERQVAEITETEYFQNLEEKAEELKI